MPIQLMIEIVESVTVRFAALTGFELAALAEVFELSALMEFELAAL